MAHKILFCLNTSKLRVSAKHKNCEQETHRTKQLNIFCMIIDESQAVGDMGKEEGTKEGDQEEKQERGVSNEEETMENGDKGGKEEYQLE